VGKPPAQRQKEARREQRMAEQSAYAAARQRRMKWFSVAVVVGIGGLLVSTILGGLLFTGDGGQTSATVPTTPPSDEPIVQITVPPAGASIDGETPCPPAEGATERVTSFSQPPPQCIDPDNRYRAVMRTSLGDMDFMLNAQQAPGTVNNFVVLARYGFYDGVPFHEIVPRTAILGGDATGQPEVGQGDPGYTIDNEIPDAGVIYPTGTLAMWTDEPDRNGSRFLIAAGDQAADLPPAFTSFGLMLDGADTLNRIQALGDPDTGRPTAQVVIESIEIIEQPPRSDDDR
jgi:cyclophilin family peptidyl-prolyl cis-trans isomerase